MTTSPRQERRSALPLPLADQTVFSFRFTPSPRGARLARRLASCVEVSDARGERLPEVRDAGSEEDGGRGLLLVAALAEEWGTVPRPGAPGKTVWAVVPTGPVRQ
ncbi:ATP-binding protein [Streptomyces sp. NPDC058698]|uniref:ATP-binding protein n=1 Tax=Streptomyces sp. NPDC058698 TaxID=3346606 RepID=UPI00365CBDD6